MCAGIVLLVAATVSSALAQGIEVSAGALVADASRVGDVEISRFGSYVAMYDTTEGNSVTVFDADLRELWRHRMSFYWAGSLEAGSVIQFAPDESYVIFPSARNDHDICICDLATGEPIEVLRGHENTPGALALSPDGRRLVSASYNEIVLWERDQSRLEERDGGRLEERDQRGFVERHTITEFAPAVKAIEFLPGGDRFVASTTDSVVRSVSVYSVEQGHIERVLHYEFEDRNISNDIYQIAVNPNGDLVAAGYRDAILLFRLGDDALSLVQEIRDIDLGVVYSLAFSPDGGALVSGHFRFLRWWVPDGSEWVESVTTATQQPVANDVEISGDGSRLLVATTADENALATFDVRGLVGSPLGLVIGALVADLSVAQRRALTPEIVSEIIERVGTAALAPRDMFETSAEYNDRVELARTRIRERIQEAIEGRYGVERVSNPVALYDVMTVLQGQGTYDIDRQRYSISVLDTDAWLHLDRNTARSLHRDWRAARIRATRYDGDAGADYADFRLVHPDGGEYPIVMEQNPFTGERINTAAHLVPAIRVGPDLVVREFALDGIFPTLHGRYEREPFGRFILENVGTGIVSDVSLRYAVDGLTLPAVRPDVPTSLAAGQGVMVELLGPISPAVLESAEGGGAALSVEISYRRGNRTHRRTIDRHVRLLGRNAIQWDDDRKIGAFMTIAHPAVLAWSGEIATAGRATTTPVLTRNLHYAMRLYESLRLAGIEYLIDPNLAFEIVSQESRIVDFVRFPHETLAVGAGDCDDLSVLYASLLESVGVATAFITTPGHIFIAFDTGIEYSRVGEFFSSPEAMIIHDGRVWMPIETTILDEGFTRAWRVGALQWRRAVDAGNVGFFTTREAWSEYAPVAIAAYPANRDSAAAPEDVRIAEAVNDELDAFRGIELDPQIRAATGENRGPATNNRLGLLYAMYGLFDEATGHFQAAFADREYVPALINQANILAIHGHHERAQIYLERARSVEPENLRVLLGLAVSYWETGDREEARDIYEVVSDRSPNLARRFALFDDDGSSPRRATDRSETIFSTDWALE